MSIQEKHTIYRYKIILSILGLVTLIVTGIIKYHPWTSVKISDVKSNNYLLSGTVVDAISNDNVTQATITVVGRTEQYITEDNGNFRILFYDTLKSVRIRVSKPNFITYDKSFDIPSSNNIIQLKRK